MLRRLPGPPRAVFAFATERKVKRGVSVNAETPRHYRGQDWSRMPSAHSSYVPYPHISVGEMRLGPSIHVIPQIRRYVCIRAGAMECRASGAVAEIMVHPFDNDKFFVHAR